MTAKDFRLIADAIRPLTDSSGCPLGGATCDGYYEALEDVADSLATALATTNPRFDRSRFMAAALGRIPADEGGAS